jgi:hypothetical protein
MAAEFLIGLKDLLGEHIGHPVSQVEQHAHLAFRMPGHVELDGEGERAIGRIVLAEGLTVLVVDEQRGSVQPEARPVVDHCHLALVVLVVLYYYQLGPVALCVSDLLHEGAVAPHDQHDGVLELLVVFQGVRVAGGA